MNTVKKWEGRIDDNYQEYIKKPLRIGFTKEFPIHDIIDTIEIKTKCRRFDVVFNVHLCNVTFGEEKYKCRAIVSEQVDIAHKLPFHGHASYCYYDEAEAMELGVLEMAKKHDLMICEKINSWPFAKAIISENHFLN